MGEIYYSMNNVSRYNKQDIIFFSVKESGVKSTAIFSTLYVPSEEPTFIPTPVYYIFITTTFDTVEDSNDHRNRIMREYKDNLL